ncbi:uncharacterized protein RHOBADRAFT_47018 [Rhodotorula graminis WP1]|uniref:Altered inheritance of mitochondria protein 6 n=1 Tax=Rhodotorula graminis (strain WP1) TaxID=578459 RepID=A0A0P9F974_RHOGW|nr:uncharacterized protein RHOBADRAFT_47018 [Rhodotorula graminis WP1]KPV72176.1 hypothetical protein RHOBADRAFT_47018 [Rhodotorula graminis WP1]
MVYIPLVSTLAPAADSAAASGNSAVLFARSTMAAISGLLVQSGLPQLNYPTSLTKGIVPKNIHSHNDYTRPVPLLDALAVGAKSVEADIHLVEGKLLVGHKSVSLTSSRTLEELYLDPILEIIKLQNPASPFASGSETAALTNGVFDYDPEQSLQLLLDYKTDPSALHPAVIDALAQFRALNLLTTFNSTSGTLTTRPLTITCTGNCDLALVSSQTPLRDIFLDAPLEDIANPAYTTAVTLMASTSFKHMFGWLDSFDVDADKAQGIAELVHAAREKGIKTRFWETPSWPAFVRDDVWRGLLKAGVDWLNVDDLRGAASL